MQLLYNGLHVWTSPDFVAILTLLWDVFALKPLKPIGEAGTNPRTLPRRPHKDGRAAALLVALVVAIALRYRRANLLRSLSN